MRIRSLLTALTMVISLNAFAIDPPYEGGPEKAMKAGQGKNRCEVSCLATCGRAPYNDELLRVHNAIGLGDNEIAAFNIAWGLCKTMAIPKCGLGEYSTPANINVVVYGKYELGQRHSKAKAYVGVYLKPGSIVEANATNCAAN